MAVNLRLFSAFIMVFLVDCLMAKAHGNDTNNETNNENGTTNNKEVKYALLGAGIGMFCSLCFLALKYYMFKKNILDNDLTDSGKKRSSLRAVTMELKTDSR
ncbi:hypothetical protein AAFF_G00332670 [Aldrovandia affinis]|uniref:Transmembrane protein n=1 Tax=Aldrovandia affinis TaxID=143900 RepID=A0AAD7WQ45_9TELE|nr:hypothetical protein AAFF_G00332670 [Aldrovandia affinis]